MVLVYRLNLNHDRGERIETCLQLLDLLLQLHAQGLLILDFALDLADFKVFPLGKENCVRAERKKTSTAAQHSGAPQPHLLLQFLIQLLLIIFQIHDAVLGQLQVSFEFPLGSLKVHAQFLLLLQGPFQLKTNKTISTLLAILSLFI